MTVQQAVMNGELDVAAADRAPGGRSERADDVIAVQSSLCVLVPRSGQWTTCDSIAPEALAGITLLIYNEDFAYEPPVDDIFSQHDVKHSCRAQRAIDFLAAMVQAGVGIAICRSQFVQRLDKGTLRWLRGKRISLAVGHDLARGACICHTAPEAWLTCCEGFWL